MKRFVFRLASVLRLRRFELERLRTEHARLVAERRRREAVVVEEIARVEKGRALLAAETRAGAAADRLALRADAQSTGRLRVAHAQERVQELEEPLAEAMRRLQKAHARVRSLERLEEKAALEHRRVEEAAEQSALEELANTRLVRRHGGLLEEGLA